MRNALLIIALSICCFVNAQTTKQISKEEYQLLKDSRKLGENMHYTFPQEDKITLKQNSNSVSQIDSVGVAQCSCVLPIDSTFTLVTFGGDSTVNDSATNAILLPFDFLFYNSLYDTVYINSNGFISLIPYSYQTYTYNGLTDQMNKVIAPFMADVDLRNPQSGKIYYKITPHSLIVKWDAVGYFDQHADKLNTFQLILTDGTDSILPVGKNLAFCYGDMQWTGGDGVQGGTNGFTGYAAQIGVNSGLPFSFGQYGVVFEPNLPGYTYNGVSGNYRGIDWMDNRSFFFDVTYDSDHVSAIIRDSLCDPLIVLDSALVSPYRMFLSAFGNYNQVGYSVLKLPHGAMINSDGYISKVLTMTYDPFVPGIDTLLIECYYMYSPPVRFMRIFDVQYTPPLILPSCNIIDQSTVPPFNFGSGMTVDDDSKLVNLPFNFNFYGTNYGAFYLNSNGNITFGSQFTGFTATGFPTNGPKMIAPFWADYDNRPTDNGLIRFSVTGTHAVITWDSMGYYNSHADKRNTCQLIITDGLDPILPSGYNVAFLYEDMGWTTGDASVGTNGFGDSIPSTVGVNRGDGTNFSQITRCGLPGTIYDGPNGNADGVDWLDYRTFYFNIATPSGTSPVGYDSLCQNLIPIYDSLGSPYRVFFNSMDVGDNISYTIIQQPTGSVITPVVVGNTTYLSMDYVPLNTGLDTLIVEYTDNLGSSPLPRQIMRIFDVQSVSTVGIKKLDRTEQIMVFPNPSEGNFTVKLNGQAKMSSLKLYNSIGNELFQANPSQNEFGLKLDFLQKGVYTIIISDSKGKSHFQKLIIQ